VTRDLTSPKKPKEPVLGGGKKGGGAKSEEKRDQKKNLMRKKKSGKRGDRKGKYPFAGGLWGADEFEREGPLRGNAMKLSSQDIVREVEQASDPLNFGGLAVGIDRAKNLKGVSKRC